MTVHYIATHTDTDKHTHTHTHTRDYEYSTLQPTYKRATPSVTSHPHSSTRSCTAITRAQTRANNSIKTRARTHAHPAPSPPWPDNKGGGEAGGHTYTHKAALTLNPPPPPLPYVHDGRCRGSGLHIRHFLFFFPRARLGEGALTVRTGPSVAERKPC